MDAIVGTAPGDAAPGIIDWAVSARTLAHEVESGDLHLVTAFGGGVLVAAIDGLGHGAEAAVAARAARDTLLHDAHDAPTVLVQRCHAALTRTRGVVMSLASFDAEKREMAWLAVGNVEGVLFRPGAQRQTLLLRGGVVGYQLPPLRPATVPILPDDLLILATDGISGAFSYDVPPPGPVQEIADSIIARHAKGTDDALVLVARYLGGAA